MENREKQIMDTLARVIPSLLEEKKEYLLGLGEGMALAHERRQEEEKEVVKATENV